MSTEQLNVSPAASAAAVSSEAERHILAERFKTKQCRNYIATGTCPYVHRCMFAHGEEDQRTYEENMRDGLFTEEAIRAWRRASRQLPPQYDAYLPSYEELFCVADEYDYDDYYYDGYDYEYGYPYEEASEVCSVGAVSSVVTEAEAPLTHYRWNPYSWNMPYAEVKSKVVAEKAAQRQVQFEP